MQWALKIGCMLAANDTPVDAGVVGVVVVGVGVVGVGVVGVGVVGVVGVGVGVVESVDDPPPPPHADSRVTTARTVQHFTNDLLNSLQFMFILSYYLF